MIFTEDKTRRLTGQKAMSFVLQNTVVKNLDADVFFGFSGEGKTLQFGFKKGKIYDPDGNYVHSYSPQETFLLSGDFSKDYYNYSINEESIARGNLKTILKQKNGLLPEIGLTHALLVLLYLSILTPLVILLPFPK